MDTKIRKAIYEPLIQGKLSEIVPDFKIHLSAGPVQSPALLTSNEDSFEFTIHFLESTPPEGIGEMPRGPVVFHEKDQIELTGQIGAEIAFTAKAYPAMGNMSRSRGTSTVHYSTRRLNLVAEGLDVLTTSELNKLIEAPDSEKSEPNSFSAHLIFHGPKLKMFNGGSDTVRKNDFLGDATNSTVDTYQFEGNGYEGALIQRGLELHLHLHSKGEASCTNNIIHLIDYIADAVGFVLGFHPWPMYREIRIDHKILERWISPRFNLQQINFGPVPEGMWISLKTDKANPFHKIIPTIAGGLASMSETSRKRLNTLLWHFRCSEFGGLPHSTRLLIVCACLDGLMKLIAGYNDPSEKPATNKTWEKASAELGLSWEKWTKGVFETFGKYRNHLAHGWLWMPNTTSDDATFEDHPLLACAFSLIIAAMCGYTGKIRGHSIRGKVQNISEIMESISSK